jgi:hypothetical protein
LPESVSQFIVVLPESAIGTLNVDLLREFLASFFPRYDFYIDTESPFVGSDYGLIPVAGRLGDGPGTMFKPAPKSDFLAIMDALRSFGAGDKALN